MEMLKNMGISMVSREEEENLQKELKRIEEENKRQIEAEKLTLEDELLEKYNDVQIKKFRELGMTDEQMIRMQPSDNPFQDFKMKKGSVTDIIEGQKKFYEELIRAFADEYTKLHKHERMDEFEYNIAIKRSLKSLDQKDFAYNGQDPSDLAAWSENKKMQFERKKLITLKEFFEQ